MKRISNIFVLLSLFLPGAARAASGAGVVVHVNFADPQRQQHGLVSVEHLLEAADRPVTVEVVAHGGGIWLLVKGRSAAPELVEGLAKKGVVFVACENSMKKEGITKAMLLPGVSTVPSGAWEVAKKQLEGYAYFRP